MLTDSHTHLHAAEFDEDREACIERCRGAEVTRIVTIGAGQGAASARQAIALAEQYPEVWATVGIHPHDAEHEFDETEFLELARHPKVVAVGETGLDFFKEWAPRERQREAFTLQVQLAKKVGKPLVIHSRDAGQECLATLRSLDASGVGGVFHCYSEDEHFAAALEELGFYVSFPGLLTFKKNEAVREVCAKIPLERILVETDAPYLAPVPYRGKRCEPSFVIETARCLATIKGLSLEEVADVTTNNALRLFSSMR